KWWRHRTAAGVSCIDEVRQQFAGELWTCDVGVRGEFGVRWLQARNQPGLATAEDTVATGGGNGRMQAVGLAWHLGATPILLLGYDMQARGDLVHWHGRHRDGLGDPDARLLARWAAAAEPIARDLIALGVEIFNCSRETAAKGWPRAALEDVLALHLP